MLSKYQKMVPEKFCIKLIGCTAYDITLSQMCLQKNLHFPELSWTGPSLDSLWIGFRPLPLSARILLSSYATDGNLVLWNSSTKGPFPSTLIGYTCAALLMLSVVT